MLASSMALTGVSQHFTRNFDQYTIMCVFGSVVGCVVFPLMAQSLESLIITAILFGVTVGTFNKKPVAANNGGPRPVPPREAQDERKKDKKAKKTGPKQQQQQQQQRHSPVQQQQGLPGMMDTETAKLQRQLDLTRKEELRLQEKEQKSEEKRRKKAKKRGEKLLKREEEKMEREKKEAALLERKKERDAQKRCKTSDLPSVDMITPIYKPWQRERNHSTSSSISSISTYSSPAPSTHPPKRRPPPRTPTRASSAPLINVPTPPPELTQQNAIPQVPSVSSPAPSQSQRPQCHAPLQMFPLYPLLPFLAPPMPHPHFLYSPMPQLPPVMQSGGHDGLSVQPHPLHYMSNSGHVTGADSADRSLLELPQVRSIGNQSTPDHVIPGHQVTLTELPQLNQFSGCGTAQGFYSVLNNQTTSPPSMSPTSNIWSPSQPWGEGQQEVWPDWSTHNN